jgi:hypothetical protein
MATAAACAVCRKPGRQLYNGGSYSVFGCLPFHFCLDAKVEQKSRLQNKVGKIVLAGQSVFQDEISQIRW